MGRTIDEMIAEEWDMQRQIWKVEGEKKEERNALIDEIDKRLAAKYAHLDELKKKHAAVIQEQKEEHSRLAEAGVGAPLPLGSKVYRDRLSRYGNHIVGTDYGIVEAVTTKTVFAANLTNTPYPGRFIVRLLKKDGTPGLGFDTFVGNWKLVEKKKKT